MCPWTLLFVSVGLVFCWLNKLQPIFCYCLLKLFQGPLAQKIEEAQKSTCKANKNKSGGNFSHAASQKKSSVTRQIVSLPKNTQGKRKKRKEQICCHHPLHPSPQPFSSCSHVWGMEDPLPKSKRRQRMERIWAQNNGSIARASMVEVKTLLSPKIH